MSTFDITTTARNSFPSLVTAPSPFFENAGGSQTLGTVITAIHAYLLTTNVQVLASNPVSDISTDLVNAGTRAAAAFISTVPENIVIGASTTQLLANLSSALSFPAGSEIIISKVDHEANIAPWVRMAKRQGLVVKWWNPADLKRPAMTAEGLRPLLSDKTRLVAVTHCSNVLGVINPIREIADLVHTIPGAMLCVDGVAMTAHRKIDVEALGVDFYVWSWYKTFGPHISTLYARPAANKQVEGLGHYFNPSETIGQKLGLAGASYELVASLPKVVEYLEQPGIWDAIASHEEALLKPLLDYLVSNPKITVHGETRADKAVRVPVLAFTVNAVPVETVRERLINEGYGLRVGHCYAKRCVAEVLGRGEEGVVRVSFVHYNTVEEVEGFVEALKRVFAADDW